MQKLIDLYLLGIKGLSVLEELIHHNFKDMINYVVVGEDKMIGKEDLINGKHILLQRGKKNYFIVKAV